MLLLGAFSHAWAVQVFVPRGQEMLSDISVAAALLGSAVLQMWTAAGTATRPAGV